jgi:glycine/D-amino acid oxidase-like deaminating enzyme
MNALESRPIPNRSPWRAQLPPGRVATPLREDTDADVVVVGAGIAGIATAHFLLRDTERSVLLVERDRVATGATGFNAGQLVSYFERPLCRLAAEFGCERALAAQRDVLSAWELLDRMIAEAGVREPVYRFTGHLGLFTLDQLVVHLENNRLRERAGLPREQILVSEKADFLGAIPDRYAPLYEVGPQYAVQERLETDDLRYAAVLSEPKGCTNAARLCEEVVESLRSRYPGRFRIAERTSVRRIRLADGHAILDAGSKRIRASRVVLCSNGFTDHAVEDCAGRALPRRVPTRVRGTIGFMAGFFEAPRRPSAISYLVSPRIGEGQAYFYVTRRPCRVDGRKLTLTCVGGPDAGLGAQGYDRSLPCPDEMVERLDAFMRPIVAPGSGAPLHFDYVWHGLMAYTRDQVRVVGAEPRNPVLLYNLACNGVGFLPSIHGGQRVARLLAGERLAPSLFDPR